MTAIASLPFPRTILITDHMDIIPEEILEVNPDQNPVLTFPQDCHLGHFPTWQAEGGL